MGHNGEDNGAGAWRIIKSSPSRKQKDIPDQQVQSPESTKENSQSLHSLGREKRRGRPGGVGRDGAGGRLLQEQPRGLPFHQGEQ